MRERCRRTCPGPRAWRHRQQIVYKCSRHTGPRPRARSYCEKLSERCVRASPTPCAGTAVGGDELRERCCRAGPTPRASAAVGVDELRECCCRAGPTPRTWRSWQKIIYQSGGCTCPTPRGRRRHNNALERSACPCPTPCAGTTIGIDQCRNRGCRARPTPCARAAVGGDKL